MGQERPPIVFYAFDLQAENQPIRRPTAGHRHRLIQSTTSEWKPEPYTDEYHKALEKMIDEKIKHGVEESPVPAKKKKPTRSSTWCLCFSKVFSKPRQNRSRRNLPRNTADAA